MILHYLAIVAPSGLVVYQKSFSNALNTSSLLGGLLTTIIVAGHRTVEGSLTYIEGLHACLSIHRQSNVMCLLFHEKCYKRVLSEMFGQLLTKRFLRAFLEEYGAELESGSLGHFVLGSFAAFDFRVLTVLHNTIRSLLRNLQTQPYVRSVILTYDDGTVESTQASDLAEKNLRFPIRVHQDHRPSPNIQPFHTLEGSPLESIAEEYDGNDDSMRYSHTLPPFPKPETLSILPTQDISVTSSCRPMLSVSEELISTLGDTLTQVSVTTEVSHPARTRITIPTVSGMVPTTTTTTGTTTTGAWRPYTAYADRNTLQTAPTALTRERRTSSKSVVERPQIAEGVVSRPNKPRQPSSTTTIAYASDDDTLLPSIGHRTLRPSVPGLSSPRHARPPATSVQRVPFRSRNLVYRVPGGLLVVTGVFVRASAERLRRDILMSWLLGDALSGAGVAGGIGAGQYREARGSQKLPLEDMSPSLEEALDTEDIVGFAPGTDDRFMRTNPMYAAAPMDMPQGRSDSVSLRPNGTDVRTQFARGEGGDDVNGDAGGGGDGTRRQKTGILKKVRSLLRRIPFLKASRTGQHSPGDGASTSSRVATRDDGRDVLYGTNGRNGGRQMPLERLSSQRFESEVVKPSMRTTTTYDINNDVTVTEGNAVAMHQKTARENPRLFFSLPVLISILQTASPYHQYQMLYTLSNKPAALSESIGASSDFTLLVVTLQAIRQYTGFDAASSTVFY